MPSPFTTHASHHNDRVTVLHIDDDPVFGELTAEFLEREDDRFDVVTETTPSEALTILDGTKIDCIVSGYEMPETDGLELLEAVRADYPDLPFILYTGKGSEEIASEAISAGVTDYLEKEAGRHQCTVLVNRVRNAVEQYRAERQLRETHEGYSTLLQESADFIFTADTERTINYVTPSVERVLGYTPDEVIGTDAFEYVHPDDLETVREGFFDVSDPDSEETTIEIQVGHQDGSWRWFELRGRNLLDDPTVGEFVVNVRDITERKEREQEIRELETFNQNLIENTPVGIFHLDEELRITYQNPRAEEIVGDPADESKSIAIGEDIRELPSIVEAGEAKTFARLEDGERIDVAFQFESVYGDESYLSGRGVPLFNDGEFDGAILILEDVTERRASERELELLRALFDRSEDEIYVVDPDTGRLQMVNDILCRNLGYDREDLLNRSVQEIDATGVTSEWTSSEWIKERTNEPEELVHERKDGTTYPVEVNATYARLEHDEYVLAIARDVSDRKKREDNLKKLHDATRRLMDATEFEEAAGIGVEAAEEILNLDITGFHALDDDALVPVATTRKAEALFDGAPTIERGEGMAWRVYETGEPIFAEDVRNYPELRNPDTVARSEMLIPADDHGVFIAAATERGAFDETDADLARVLVANLSHAIDSVRRECQLRDRERALERENERLEDVASIVSHDLRNPLNVVEGRLNLARQECESEHFEPIVSSLDRSFEIIEDVLTLVQQGQSFEETQTETVTLSTAVENCWRNVDTSQAEFRIESDVAFAANPERFRHVLENLFRNAAEHASEDVTIRVGRFEDGFYVEDDGPGVPPENRELVFDSGYSTADNGTGFGLHIVQQIVDAHGWKIEVDEGDAGGARFEITGVDVAT